jgi:eukaryotic-like serine/threonine-protein kinase
MQPPNDPEQPAMGPMPQPASGATAVDPEATLPAPQARTRPLPARPEQRPDIEPETGSEHVSVVDPAAAQVQPDDAPAQNLSGLRLGAWTLRHQIGQGGMGEVWLAERSDALYEALAAIKLVRSDVPPEHLAARFARERAVLARLDHPAIARLLDAGVDDGRAYIVLEYVQGLPLNEHVRRHCPDVRSRVELLVRVAEAVDHAHARLVVHRDLKPANVLVAPNGKPKLLDFGIAGLLSDDEQRDGQLTRLTGRRVTIGYAAPEQITGEPVGVTADVFSLGVMLFQVLSGEMPFGADANSRVAAEHALLHDDAPRLARLARRTGGTGSAEGTRGTGKAGHTGSAGGRSRASSPLRPVDAHRVRGDLEAIVAKALRKQPAERYSSVRVLIDDLQRWLDSRPVSVRNDDWRHRLRLGLRRHRLAALAGMAVLFALSAGLATSLWQWQRAQHAAQAAQQVTAYLGDLLASAKPESHGGQVPTVLQLLETSRQDVAQRFEQEPDIQERLLAVLSQTYLALNRSDLALPLAQQRVALADRLHEADGRRPLLARLELGRILAMREAFDQVVATVKPLRDDLPRVLGERSDEHRTLLYLLAYADVRLGRYDEGRVLLAEAGRVTDAMYPAGDFERVFHDNHVQVLEVSAGRLRAGLAALERTRPYWPRLLPSEQRSRHTLERNMIAVQVRLGETQGLLERGLELLQRIDALMGPGSDQATGLRAELARSLSESGRYAEAWAQRQAVLDTVPSAMAPRSAAQSLPERAQALLAQAQAQPQAAVGLLRRARALLSELDTAGSAIGIPGLYARAALLRLALVLTDRPLADQVLMSLRSDPRLSTNHPLRGRVDRLEAAMRRWHGDPAGSRALLQPRVDEVLALPETRTPTTWSTLLDHATTLTDLRSPDAPAALQVAVQSRPAGLPADVPLDRLQAWLQLRQRADDDGAQAVHQAWIALAQRLGRSPDTERAALLAQTLF